ncbi:MAG: hypothetical protein P0S95_03825 [Rhabdochlamydiaceae bacterium]|nr:hypothetical protein [Candidatus Amphrikana amoebophyrae]
MRSIFLLCAILIFGSSSAQLKVLHLTFHNGCKKEIESLSSELNFNLETMVMHKLPIEQFDGRTIGGDRYNIDSKKAFEIWKRNKEYFDSFDLIITSDTAPLSRIFLQNNFQKPLIIWVCNRFDYTELGSRACDFPDKAYYQMIQDAANKPNVALISYTEFEHVYATRIKNTKAWNQTIQPIGQTNKFVLNSSPIPKHINKKETFFVPPYHNDTIFMNLSKKLSSIGIPNYCGRYNGPLDLQDFKGIIHIPYAWSNLALFENWERGKIYFIPSLSFICRLSREHNFFWSPPLIYRYLTLSEWYRKENKSNFVFFNSFDDLIHKISTTDYETKKLQILEFHKQHKNKTLKQWKTLFNSLFNNQVYSI